MKKTLSDALNAPAKKREIFAAATLMLAAAGAYISGTFNPLARTDQQRTATTLPVTPGESALLKAIFGSSFSTADLRKNYIDYSAQDGAWRTRNETTLAYVSARDKNDIYFLSPDDQKRDYSRTQEMDGSPHTFIHEAVHIWQNRTGSRAKHCKTYSYTLTSRSQFSDFCDEQQAEMVADYAVLFLDKNSVSLAMSDLEEYGQLLRVVETQFPAAKDLRLKLMARVEAQIDCADKHGMGSPQCGGYSKTNLLGQAPLPLQANAIRLPAPTRRS